MISIAPAGNIIDPVMEQAMRGKWKYGGQLSFESESGLSNTPGVDPQTGHSSR